MANKTGGRTNTIDLIPAGWEQPDWIVEYFPDDLPEEWRLAYFANEFPSVLLPLTTWADAGDDEIATWAEDLTQDFRIYLEATTETRPGRLGQVLSMLGRHIVGVVQHSSSVQQPGPVPFSFHESPTEAIRCPSPVACMAPGSIIGDLPDARRLLESLARRPASAPAVLILNPVSPEALRRWWQLAYLAGVA